MNINVPAIVKHCNQPVLTLSQIAPGYQTTIKNLQQDFINNRENFTPGKHYYSLEGEELENFKLCYPNFLGNKVNRSVLLFTKKGALLLAKSVNTKPAWQAYDALIDYYFDFEANLLLKILTEPHSAFEYIHILHNKITQRAKEIGEPLEIALALLVLREASDLLRELKRDFEGYIKEKHPGAYIKGRRGGVMHFPLFDGQIFAQQEFDFEISEEPNEAED